MALSPHHTFQVLTKRAARMRSYMTDPLQHNRMEIAAEAIKASEGKPWSPKHVLPRVHPNVWFGVSTERQQEADERIVELLQTPAAVRFISYEPALGALNLKRWMPSGKWGTFKGEPVYHQTYFMTKCDRCGWFGSSELAHVVSYGDDADVACPQCHEIFICDDYGDGRGLHWVICGGESGPDARPMHPDWARSLRDQCAAANVPFFFKQWGRWSPTHPDYPKVTPHAVANDGAAYFSPDIAYPDGPRYGEAVRAGHDKAHLTSMYPIGKAKAGRLLDGIEHNAMPGRPA